MFKVIFNVVLVFIVVLLLVNKFYVPLYCDKFSWKSVQYSIWSTDKMKVCADNKMCKIWAISNNKLWEIKVKNWKCVARIDK